MERPVEQDDRTLRSGTARMGRVVRRVLHVTWKDAPRLSQLFPYSMRLSFAAPDVGEIREGVARLARAFASSTSSLPVLP